MATLQESQIAQLNRDRTQNKTIATLEPFLEKYFPGAKSFKPSLEPAGHGDGGYARIFDIEVYDADNNVIEPTNSDYHEELDDMNEALTFDDNSIVKLNPPFNLYAIAISNDLAWALFPHDKIIHETPYGTFSQDTADVALEIVKTLDKQDIEDILENDTTSTVLENVDMSLAFALNSKGMERVNNECLETDVKLSNLLFGCQAMENLCTLLAKYMLVNAAKELTTESEGA